ncbi:MAG TPA: ABC transporter ATP-binding protein [Clostridia bacterium]|nr:ABC transporter ATP-binding protein [Clostridia bacterium]
MNVPNEAVIRINGLFKRYGSVNAVNGISLKIGKGEVFGLLGPNGAGKTTTLECLEGIRRADGGILEIGGCDPQSDERSLRHILGVQLQSSSLPEGLRPAEAMSLICAWHGLPDRLDLLDRFGLTDQNRKQYRELSEGQKRRLHLALALACNPSAVILDEPTAGLDVQGRAQLHDAIRELKNSGVTVLLATHDMAEAETLCDRVAIMIKGRIAVVGSPAQVTASGNPDVRILLSTKNGCLQPGMNTGNARFLRQTDNYGVWLSADAASAVMELLKYVQAFSDTVEDLRVERPSLEERFLELVEGGTRR